MYHQHHKLSSASIRQRDGQPPPRHFNNCISTMEYDTGSVPGRCAVLSNAILVPGPVCSGAQAAAIAGRGGGGRRDLMNSLWGCPSLAAAAQQQETQTVRWWQQQQRRRHRGGCCCRAGVGIEGVGGAAASTCEQITMHNKTLRSHDKRSFQY